MINIGTEVFLVVFHAVVSNLSTYLAKSCGSDTNKIMEIAGFKSILTTPEKLFTSAGVEMSALKHINCLTKCVRPNTLQTSDTALLLTKSYIISPKNKQRMPWVANASHNADRNSQKTRVGNSRYNTISICITIWSYKYRLGMESFISIIIPHVRISVLSLQLVITDMKLLRWEGIQTLLL